LVRPPALTDRKHGNAPHEQELADFFGVNVWTIWRWKLVEDGTERKRRSGQDYVIRLGATSAATGPRVTASVRDQAASAIDSRILMRNQARSTILRIASAPG
jgi:hypothetical protein